MASTTHDTDLFGDLGEAYENAIDYLDDTVSDGQEEDGEFEDAFEEYPEEIIECTDIVADQRYDAEGGLVCRFEGKKYWHPACHHVDIRHRLYNDAAQLGEYDFGREAGDDPRDKTSLLPSQKSWGLERAHRPQELFVFEPPQNRRTQVLGNVQPMYRYQRIVLNFHNQIIKDYEHIPDTLSSEFEGAFMEAITRKDVRIDVEDFRSRMLESITLKGTQRELYKFNIFSSRMRRFREASFNLVWTVKRSGSETIMDFMASFLPPDCKTSNSTRNFRDMYKHEMILKEMLGFGRSLFRAGNNGRAVTPASREASYKKLVAKYDKLYEIFTKEQQKLANGLLPLSSTRRLESPAYHRLHLHWRAIIDRQRGEVADEDDEDAETASDEGIAFAPGTIANVEERATSRTYGNATARKRSFTDVEGEAVHEGSTNSSKRRRYSPTKRFLDVTEDNGSGQFYDLMPGFSTEIVTGTAPVLDPTLKAHVQASRGQKKDLDSVGNNTFAGEEIGFHSHPRDFRPLKRLRPTDEEKSQFIHNVGEKIAVKALSLPDNGGGLQNLKPGRKPRARSPAYRTAPGHQQANTRSGYDAWSTNPGNPYHPAPSMNLPPYQGMHEQPSPNIPTPCFSRKKYSDPPEYEEQHAYNVRQQIRRRPPPTIYPPLRSELMQEEQAQVLRPDVLVGTESHGSAGTASFDEQYPATGDLISESEFARLDQDTLNFWKFVPDESFWQE